MQRNVRGFLTASTRLVLCAFVVLVFAPKRASAQAARDMINLSQAIVEHSPSDIASWPVTVGITQVQESPVGSGMDGFAFSFSTAIPDSWKLILDSSGDNFQYTVWAVVRVNGQWYTAGFIQMWQGRPSTGAPWLYVPPSGCTPPGINNFACNWAYSSRWGPMAYSVSGYQPQAGEAIGLFVSAGNARDATGVSTVRERSNVVVLNLPAGDSGVFNFTYAYTTALLAGDFDGNGHPDLISQTSDGMVNLSLTSDGVNFSQLQSPYNGITTAWRIAGVGDFNHDGRPDLVWQGPTGSVAVWLNNGSSPPTVQYLYAGSTDWRVMAVADMNRDGYADLIWQSPVGQVAVWFMQGSTVLQAQVVWSNTSVWRIVGAADFNGDGDPDLLWQGPTGALALWTMHGFTVASTVMLYGSPSSWLVIGVGDVNGDGQADVIWRGPSGQVAVWLMSGSTISSGQYLNGSATGWQRSTTPQF